MSCLANKKVVEKLDTVQLELDQQRSGRAADQTAHAKTLRETEAQLAAALDKASRASEEDVKKLRYSLEQESLQKSLEMQARKQAETVIIKLEKVSLGHIW